MYSRLLQPPDTSFFLFGPRGTGKSRWVQQALPDAFAIDLLESATAQHLQGDPGRLEGMVPKDHRGWVVIAIEAGLRTLAREL